MSVESRLENLAMDAAETLLHLKPGMRKAIDLLKSYEQMSLQTPVNLHLAIKLLEREVMAI